VEATLYSLKLSHPSRAALGMLRHKGVEPKVVDIPPGLQPLALRGLGFKGGTVPALKLDGRRIHGSLAIARALEELLPDPPLYPADPAERRRVEAAERWGDAVFQPVPRRLFRWIMTNDREARRWLTEVSGIPAPGIVAVTSLPQAVLFARMSGADEKRVRADVAEIPSHLDHIDNLIGEGILNGERLNAADFQAGVTTRALLGFPELAALVEGRPAGAHARRVLPDYPGPMPPGIPKSWL